MIRNLEEHKRLYEEAMRQHKVFVQGLKDLRQAGLNVKRGKK